MYKKIIIIGITALMAFFFSACTSKILPYQSIIDHGLWESVDRERVFTKCVNVLHSKGYMIISADSGSGFISADWISFNLENVLAKYRMNFMIPEQDGENVKIYVKVNANWDAETGHSVNRHLTNVKVNNRINEDLRDMFATFERAIGKTATSIGTSMLNWD